VQSGWQVQSHNVAVSFRLITLAKGHMQSATFDLITPPPASLRPT